VSLVVIDLQEKADIVPIFNLLIYMKFLLFAVFQSLF